MTYEEGLANIIQAFGMSIEKQKNEEYENIISKLKNMCMNNEHEFYKSLEDAMFNINFIIMSCYNIPKQKYMHIFKYLVNGIYGKFIRKYIDKYEGTSCGGDKESFIFNKTLKALKTGKNLSLYQDYTEVEQIKENKKEQAYWSPKTIPDTNTALQLFVDWLNLELNQ